MGPRQYVGYCRISSPKPHRTDLSLEAQREAVSRYVQDRAGKLVEVYSEVRSGIKSAGPQLREAL
jgi:DNA invertase Pin-like site-specific DNA recombinase